jgi:hypothetical protein
MSRDTFSRTTRNQLKQVFDVLRELMTPPAQPAYRVRHAGGEEGQELITSSRCNKGRVSGPCPASSLGSRQ